MYVFIFRIVLFVYMLPVLVITIFNLTIGRMPKPIHLGIINDENPSSCLYQSSFDLCDSQIPLSCKYIHEMEKHLTLVINTFYLRYITMTRVDSKLLFKESSTKCKCKVQFQHYAHVDIFFSCTIFKSIKLNTRIAFTETLRWNTNSKRRYNGGLYLGLCEIWKKFHRNDPTEVRKPDIDELARYQRIRGKSIVGYVE